MGHSFDSDDRTVGLAHTLGAGICAFVGGAILGSAHGMWPVIVPLFAAASGITAGLMSVAVYRWRRKGGCPHVAGLWSVGVSLLCYPLVLVWLLVLVDGFSFGGRDLVSEFTQMLAFGFIVSAWAVIPTGYLCGYVSARMISARYRRLSASLEQ